MAEASMAVNGGAVSATAALDKMSHQIFSAPGQLLLAAEALIAKSRFDVAEQYLSHLGRYRVLAPRVQLLRARMAISQGDTGKGEQMLLDIARSSGAAMIPPDLPTYPALRILRETGTAAALQFLDQIRTVADPRAAELHAKLLAVSRRFVEAVRVALLGAMRAPFPEKAYLVFLCGRLLAMQRDYPRAIPSLGRALSWLPPDWRFFFRAARIAEKAAKLSLAERWLGMALSLGGPPLVLSAALGRVRLAAGNIPGALVAYRGARRMTGGVANRLQIVEALFKRGFHRQALGEVEAMLAETPRCLEAKRLQVEILLALGRVRVACQTIEDFVAANADLPEIRDWADKLRAAARNRKELAIKRAAALLEQPIPAAFRLPQADFDRRSWLAQWDGLKTQMNVIGAMMIRETVARFSESKIGYLWAVLEPTVQVGFLALIFLFAERHIPYNMPIGLFIVTGMLSFLFFMNCYTRAANTLRATGGILAHPSVEPLDLVISSAILQMAVDFMILSIFLIAIVLYRTPVRIENPLVVGFCILMLWSAGLGVGLAIDAFSQRFHWARLVGWVIVRKLFFASGLFFAPDQLPSWMEKIFMYNPLLNLITVIRANFCPFVHTPGVSLGYGAEWCIAVLMFGFVAHTSMPRK
jgi:capsular polysaccharide transport system permease protein